MPQLTADVAETLTAQRPPVAPASRRAQALVLLALTAAAGTGTRTSYGFPKPFFFRWESWEALTAANLSFAPLWFAGNTLFWLAALSLAVAVRVAWRR